MAVLQVGWPAILANGIKMFRTSSKIIKSHSSPAILIFYQNVDSVSKHHR